MNAAFVTMFSHSLLWNAQLQDTAAPSSTFPKSLNVLHSSESMLSSSPITSGWNVTAVTLRPPACRRSLLDSGCVVRASCLDDLRPRSAGLVILVAVVRGGTVAALVLTDMDDYAGGGGRGRVKLVLLPWEPHKEEWWVYVLQCSYNCFPLWSQMSKGSTDF